MPNSAKNPSNPAGVMIISARGVSVSRVGEAMRDAAGQIDEVPGTRMHSSFAGLELKRAVEEVERLVLVAVGVRHAS